jgi:GxxExxY protein
MVVDDAVVVELKAVEQLLPADETQLMTYLRLTGKRVGLVINFNVSLLHKGIIRRVL